MSMSWNDIFRVILPRIQSGAGESSIKTYIGSALFSRSEEELNDQHKPFFVNRLNVDTESFQVVKVQMIALGFVDIVTDTNGKKYRKKWISTKLGTEKMYQIMAVKKV